MTAHSCHHQIIKICCQEPANINTAQGRLHRLWNNKVVLVTRLSNQTPGAGWTHLAVERRATTCLPSAEEHCHLGSIGVLTPAGQALCPLLLGCPAPTSEWPGNTRGYGLYTEMNERSSCLILKLLYCSPGAMYPQMSRGPVKPSPPVFPDITCLPYGLSV